MLKVKNVKVYELRESIISCRNAMRTEIPVYDDLEFDKSLIRAKKLVKASTESPDVKCHDNFLVGIRVAFDVVYPQYWTPEFQRYHFADIVTSASKMHRLLKMDIGKACNEYVSQAQIDQLQKDIDVYNEVERTPDNEIEALGLAMILRSGKVITDFNKGDALYHAFMRCISDCPEGLELFMRVNTNYKQLQTIYAQRRNHKLREDWGAFCDFIKGLPYAEEFITLEK